MNNTKIKLLKIAIESWLREEAAKAMAKESIKKKGSTRDRIDLQIEAANIIGRLIHTRYNIAVEQKNSHRRLSLMC